MEQDLNIIRNALIEKVKKINHSTFNNVANEIFEYQASNNIIFKEYLSNLKHKTNEGLKFLPISAFKNKKVITGDWQSEDYFESSGTTGSVNSKHYYQDINPYLENCVEGFEKVYGKVKDYCVLALLPHYLERQNSSLIAMVNDFILKSTYNQSGFFLDEVEQLVEILNYNQHKNIPTILFGVSFALKDFAEKNSLHFPGLNIIETGGMKGRQEEITREQLHSIIKKGFGTDTIHSEYGMTELFSQAYSIGQERFYPAPTMKILIKEITDPITNEKNNKTGIINIIDLANIDTCSFIATEDLGKMHDDGSFEVLGRMDNSDMRGCNLLIS